MLNFNLRLIYVKLCLIFWDGLQHMSQDVTRPWLIILLLAITVIFIVLGLYALYHHQSNIMSFAMLGLGIGGLIAGWGAYLSARQEQKQDQGKK